MATDRNLLFGLLALRNGLVNQVQLVAAFQAWTLDKSQDLAEIHVDRGDLNSIASASCWRLPMDQYLQRHGGSVGQSSAAVSAGKSTRDAWPDIDATLAHVPSRDGSTEDGDADRTASYAVGTATSDG